jgi:hypothetical protein
MDKILVKVVTVATDGSGKTSEYKEFWYPVHLEWVAWALASPANREDNFLPYQGGRLIHVEKIA